MPVAIASPPAIESAAAGRPVPAANTTATDPRPAAVIEAIVESRRMIARLQATEAMLLAAAYDLGVEQIGDSTGTADPDRDLPLRSLAAQIGAATRTADRTVGMRMADAAAVRGLFPHTLAAQAAGRSPTSTAG